MLGLSIYEWERLKKLQLEYNIRQMRVLEKLENSHLAQSVEQRSDKTKDSGSNPLVTISR